MREVHCSRETEYGVISEYVKGNLSTRQLCKKYPELSDYTGFKSHLILKKYNLRVKHKGALYLLTNQETKKIVKNIIRSKNPDKSIPSAIRPSILERYKGTFLLTDSIDSAYYCLDGELRNNILKFFREQKKKVGICQVPSCVKTNLENAHKRNYERKNIFKIAAKNNHTKIDNKLKFDVYNLMRDFLLNHKKGAIYFLCKNHHIEYDKSKDPKKFIEKLKAE